MTNVNAAINEELENSLVEMMNKCNYAPGEIIVAMKKEVSGIYRKDSVNTIFENIETEMIKKLTFNPLVDELPYSIEYNKEESLLNLSNYRDFYLLKLSDKNDMVEILEQIIKRDDVEIAEPNYIDILNYTYDSLSSYQYSLDKIGVGAAWDKGFTGKSTVTVGIIDSGIDYSHNDLIGNVDFTLAKNIYLNTSDVTDINGHGTFIAGIIGADVNGTGVVGVNKSVTMVPLKVSYDSTGNAYVSTRIDAVNYAATYGIDILNMSYELSSRSTLLETAVNNYNGLFITTSGNDGLDIDININGKCNDIENWIVVGASGSLDELPSFSNYGATYVDLFAPGDWVYSTTLNNTYGYKLGTSYAAPHVAAAAAVIMAHATHLTPLQVKDLLLNTTVYCSAFDNKCVTDGRLSLINAVNYLYNEVRPAYSKGDVTGDGRITSTDYLIIQRIFLGTYTPTAQQLDAADVNNSGTVTSVDYLMVQRYFYQTFYFPPY
ncbi:MAG TPA: hypothetical protein DCP51_03720 [Clostridiales bacterium]|nr:hypothetical protein [Clostridiales bacterium]